MAVGGAVSTSSQLEGAAERPVTMPVPITPLVGREQPAFLHVPVQPTLFVGRGAEVAAAAARLRQKDVRLLVMTGAGGVGKTRLAIAVIAALREDFRHGGCFVNLAPVTDPALVLPTVAHALGLDEDGQPALPRLVAALQERHFLLVLDNVEQVVDATPSLGDLLAGCPDLTILATSRVRLHLSWEHAFPVPPLSLPDPDRLPSADALGEVEAIQLFVTRAQAVAPDFALTGDNAPAVAAICHRLDGLPLAIELASARLRHFSPAALLTQLSTRLPLLTGGPRDVPARLRTMRNAIAWSYDLLTSDEQAILRCLGVFAGGFTLDVVERVMGDRGWVMGDGEPDPSSPSPITHHPSPSSVLDRLSSLVDKSLLRPAEVVAGEPRFALLETVREYALEQLAAAGEEAETRQRHAIWYLTLAERAASELLGEDQLAWLDRLDAEHDNLRAALTWSISHELATALRTAGALWRFWSIRGYLSEGRDWLDRALAGAGEPTATRATALRGAGALAEGQGDYERATARHEEALAIWQALGERRHMALAFDDLGTVAHDQGNFERAVAFHEEALAILREVGTKRDVVAVLNNLAAVALYQHQLARASVLYEEALHLVREGRDRVGTSIVLSNLGIVAEREGDLERAAALHTECLALVRELRDQQGIGIALNNLGKVESGLGRLDQAAAFYAEALAVLQGIGDRRVAGEVLHNLGDLARGQHDAPRAVAHFRSALTLFQQVGDRLALATTLEALASVLPRREAALAARLLGAADAIREAISTPVADDARDRYNQSLAAIRLAAGERTFAQSWAAGRVMTVDQAVAAALDEEERAAEPVPAAVKLGLTPRELEVLAHIVQGRQDREIADLLSISTKTASNHVASIIAKLGVATRTAAATYAVQQQLI